MKKNIILIIALILIIILLSVWIIHLQLTNPNWNKVNISIKDNPLTYTGATFIIENKNLIATDYLIDDYNIYKNDGNNWIQVPELATNHIDNFVPTFSNPKILYTYEEFLSWEDTYGELDSGTYRIDLIFNSQNKDVDTKVIIPVEFTL